MTTPEKMGPYEINDRIGQGGMGTVYAARHVESGEAAAVKVLTVGTALNEAFRDRFRVEIESLKKLQHPNIVSLYGYGEEEGVMFYAMELVEGKSLQDLLEDGTRFEWKQVTEFAIEICRALKHAQDHGIIHRDLKPANLLMTESGMIKLSDFGIAKLFGAAQMTVDGGVIGSVHYMSPEQADGQRVTARSDLYSLGAVLYTALARRPPFASSSPAHVLHSLKFDTPAPLKQLAPGIPDELERIIMQLLEKDPAKRIATPLSAANRLSAMLNTLIGNPEESQFFSQPTANAVTEDVSLSQIKIDDSNVSATRTIGIPDNGERPLTLAADESLAPATPVSHYTTVDSERSTISSTSGEASTPAWVIAAMLVVGLVGILFLVFFLTRPPSAGVLYSRIEATAKRGGALESVEDEIDEFVRRFPDDPRWKDAMDFRQEIRQGRMKRQFERQSRQLGEVENIEPIERTYLSILRLAQRDPEQALTKTQALLALYSNVPPRGERTQVCLDLARLQLVALEQRVRDLEVSETAGLRSRMEAIAGIRQESPEMAAAMYRAVITLYEQHPWSKEMVSQARAALESLATENGQKSNSKQPEKENSVTRQGSADGDKELP